MVAISKETYERNGVETKVDNGERLWWKTYGRSIRS